MSDTQVAQPQAVPVKPDKTDFIAMHGAGWGSRPDADIAIYQALHAAGYSAIDRLRVRKEKLEVKIFEVSEDWKVFDCGTAQASYLAEVATAKYGIAELEKVFNARECIEENIEYRD
jgi:hypothetical protein